MSRRRKPRHRQAAQCDTTLDERQKKGPLSPLKKTNRECEKPPLTVVADSLIFPPHVRGSSNETAASRVAGDNLKMEQSPRGRARRPTAERTSKRTLPARRWAARFVLFFASGLLKETVVDNRGQNRRTRRDQSQAHPKMCPEIGRHAVGRRQPLVVRPSFSMGCSHRLEKTKGGPAFASP